MNREQVMEKINGVFHEVFEDDSLVVTDQTTASDIEDWDSLAHLQLIAQIEQTFGIKFSLGEITGFANVGEMCDSVIKHQR